MTFDADRWRNTSVDQNTDNDGPPDVGEYEVELTDASFFVSKAGNPVIKLELRVTSPAAVAGYTWTEIRGLATEGQMKAAKATCARLGIDVDAIDSQQALDAELKACKGRYYSINVVQNGQYRNVYINDRVTQVQDDLAIADARQPATTAAAGTGTDDDETIPFKWDDPKDWNGLKAHVSRW